MMSCRIHIRLMDNLNSLRTFTKLHHGESLPMNDEEYDEDAKSVMVEPPSRVHSPSPDFSDNFDYNDDVDDSSNHGQSAYFQEQEVIDQNREISLHIERDVKLSVPTFSSETQLQSFDHPEVNMEL